MSELRRITERFRLEKRVSSKESGSVFRALDTQSGETVAVKLINAGDSEEQRDAFLALAGALQALQHPALPRVLDFGFTTAGSAFVVTEYLDGVSFAEYAGAPPARVLALLLLLLDGLEALAERGIAHGNLSAENLLVVPGPEGEQIKVLGLGSDPFHPDGGSADPRSGLLAFAVLAGRLLGVDASPGPAADVGLPLELAVELEAPEALRSLLEAVLRGDPEGRYPGYAEVRRDLRRALFGDTGRRAATQPLAPEPPPGGTAQLSISGGWEEVRMGQESPPGLDLRDATLAVDRLGTLPGGPSPAGTAVLPAFPGAPSPQPANRAAAIPPGNETRALRLDDLAPSEAKSGPEPPEPPRREGTLRVVPPPAAPAGPASPAATTGTILIPMAGSLQALAPQASPEEEPAPRRGATIPFPARPKPVPAESRPAEERESSRAGDTTEIPVERPVPERLPPSPPFVPPAQVPPPVPAPPREAAPPPPLPEPTLVPAPVPAQPPPRPAPAAKAPRPAGGKPLLLWVGVPVAAFLVLAMGGLAVWLWQRTPEPPPRPVQVRPAPPPPRPAPPVAETPPPVNPQIALAENYLATGDTANAKVAIEAILPEQIALFTSDDQTRYQQVLDALAPIEREKWAGSLARGLSTGDLRLLRSAVGSPPDAATLTPQAQKDLVRARRIIDLDARLSKAERARNPGEALRLSTQLLAELPRQARAGASREKAAAALEAQADEKAAAGQLEAALAFLQEIRESWPDRPGLSDRIERLGAERRADDELESVLAAAQRAERDNRPLDGLQRLAGVEPNSRYAERFRQARERLEAQFTQLDRLAPEIALRGASDLSYDKKDATVRIPLRITDDFGVKSAEAFARPEKGQYTRLAVRQVNGADYEIEITPALHRNKDIDFYVTATDTSGHQGQLGTAQIPRKVKRKKFFDKILGDKD